MDDVLAKRRSRREFVWQSPQRYRAIHTRRDLVGELTRSYFCGVPLNQTIPRITRFTRMAAEEGVVPQGTTGAGLYSTPETKVSARSFIHHIQIGRELNKPVIVHTRDARADTLAILREEK
ncbi:TatD family hydrolase [Shigella flexneri]